MAAGPRGSAFGRGETAGRAIGRTGDERHGDLDVAGLIAAHRHGDVDEPVTGLSAHVRDLDQ